MILTFLNDETHESGSSCRTAASATWMRSHPSTALLRRSVDLRRKPRPSRMVFLSSLATFWS
jgi:hypothetical protein